MRAALCAALVLAAAAPARAQPDKPAARGHFERGQAAYQSRDYDSAIREFRQAYALDADPVYLFNIGQAYRLKGDCESAADYFQRYLDAVPDTPKRAKVAGWIGDCKPAPAAERSAPAPAPAPVLRADPTTAPIERPAPIAPHDGGRTLRIAGLATAAAGGALVLIGGGFAISAAATESDLEDQCAAGCEWDDIKSRDASARTRATIAKVAFGVGGAAAATGVALYFWGRSRRAEVPVTVAPTQGGAVVTGTFGF